MQVIGDGMLARGFRDSGLTFGSALLFASGVASSRCDSESAYARERLLLADALGQCSRQGLRLVYFSTCAVYGPDDTLKDETAPVAGVNRYIRHKLDCETDVTASGVAYLIIRLTNVVGPSANLHQLVPALFLRAVEGDVTLYRDATRDLLDIDDVVSGTAALLAAVDGCDVVNLASGASVPVAEIFTIVRQIVGVDVREHLLPGGDSQRIDVSKARSLTGLDRLSRHEGNEQLLRKYAPHILDVITRHHERAGR